MKGQKQASPNSRWIPIALIVSGVVCTSWNPALGSPLQISTLAADTVIKKDKDKGKSTKTEPVKPAEKALTPQEPRDPGKTYKYTLPEDDDRDFDRDDEDWEEWADDLEETLEEMVEELTRGLSSMRFNINIEPDLEDLDDLDELGELDIDLDLDEDAIHEFEFRSRKLEDRARDMDRRMRERFDEEWEERMERREEEIERRSEDIARNIERSMEAWGESFELKMKDFEKKMKSWEEDLKEFERELRRELIEDGYLREGEKIRDLSWDDDGDIEVNGQEIREEHEDKYRELHKKYFGTRGRHFRYVE